jgi:hypothetical protein
MSRSLLLNINLNLSKSDILINEGTTSQIFLKNSSRQDCNFEHIIVHILILRKTGFFFLQFNRYWSNKSAHFFLNNKNYEFKEQKSFFFNLIVTETTNQPTLFGGHHLYVIFENCLNWNESFEWIIEVYLETLNSISIGKCVYTRYCTTKLVIIYFCLLFFYF